MPRKNPVAPSQASPSQPKKAAAKKTVAAPARVAQTSKDVPGQHRPKNSARQAPRKKKEPTRVAAEQGAPTAYTAASIGASSTKQAQLIALLRSEQGVEMAQLCAVTGWQAHSVRGVISGVLRKKLGLSVRSAADAAGVRRYRIEATPTA